MQSVAQVTQHTQAKARFLRRSQSMSRVRVTSTRALFVSCLRDHEITRNSGSSGPVLL